MVWYFHIFKNFPVCCDPLKTFSVVNEAEEYTWFIQTMSPECLTGESYVMRFKILNLLFLQLIQKSGGLLFIFDNKNEQEGKRTDARDFPGSPVVKTLPSNAGVAGSILGLVAKIPHA